MATICAVENHEDPTLDAPPGYHGAKARADAIYGEAFRKFFEYMKGTGVLGDYLEFGTFRGYTARLIACLIQEFELPGNLFLFDSFQGLPEIQSAIDQSCYEVAVNQVWFKGQMAVEGNLDARIAKALSTILPEYRIKIVKGLFEETLDVHLPKSKAALIHIDCDLYSSSKYVLDKVLGSDILQDGCIITFDDFNCNRASPRMGERRAMLESFAGQDRYDYSLLFTYGWHGQAFFIHDRLVGDKLAKPRRPFFTRVAKEARRVARKTQELFFADG